MGSHHASSTATNGNVSRTTSPDDKKTARSHVGTAEAATRTLTATSKGTGDSKCGDDEQNDGDVETSEEQ